VQFGRFGEGQRLDDRCVATAVSRKSTSKSLT
jgi:hypothetical protein